MLDTEIVELYWKRDESAIRQTEIKYGGYCRKVSGSILQDELDVEECVSDTWLRAWNSIPPARPQILRAFLAKITRNLSLDRWRAGHAARRDGGALEALDELAECVADTKNVEGEAEQKELQACIRRFVNKLPERERNVFVRRYFFGEAAAEIAERYGLKTGHVPVILARIRKKLAEELRKEGYGL